MNNKDRDYIDICEKFKEIFGGVISSETILKVCTDNNWDFDVCFDKLIECSENKKKSSNLPPLPPVAIIESMETTKENGFSGIGHALKASSISSTNLPLPTFLGAIPKKTHSSPAIINNVLVNKEVSQKTNQANKKTNLFDSIVDSVNACHKIMIILRGAPGSGKSYLAHKIIDQTVKENHQKFIYSTDDYFYDINDRYIYRPEKLSDAHEYNQKKVRKRCADGWSPVIIDNTNIKVWEMLPYVQAAIQNGYDFEILEPNTPWANSAGKLALKNKHNVPKDKIEKMLMFYEPCTKLQLFQMMKNTEYSAPIPQLRRYPPIPYNKMDFSEAPNKLENNETENQLINLMENNDINGLDSWIKIDKVQEESKEESPKPPRSGNYVVPYSKFPNDIYPIEEMEWKPYEEEASDFWKNKYSFVSDVNPSLKASEVNGSPRPQRLNNKEKILSPEEKIVNILKQDFDEKSTIKNCIPIQEDVEYDKVVHDINCPFGNVSFFMAKQVFPTKNVSDLWNLFELCNGEVNILIDHILKDDTCLPDKINNDEDLEFCKCTKTTTKKRPDVLQTDKEQFPLFEPVENLVKKKINNHNKALNLNPESAEVIKTIENNVVVPDRFYSDFINKIKKSKRPQENDVELEPDIYDTCSDVIENNNFKNSDDSDSDTNNQDGNEIIEINLGAELVQQLENMFDGDGLTTKNTMKNFKTNIFMPKSLANQLYILWVESFYNQQEEQKIQMIREDEDFAKLLHNTSVHLDNQDSYKDILDMEMAWSAYKSDVSQWKNSKPENLAQHLTELKLQEMYPNYKKENLLEIFETHNKSFSETVSALTKNNDYEKNNEEMKIKKDNLLHFVQNETEKESNLNIRDNKEKVISSDEIRRDNALTEFEESRNLAAHFSQLKAECYEKAKDAFRKNQTSVAVYYSQIATLHKNKIDRYNQLAANSIMEVHELSQSNPDFIDLHYLHTNEAIQCLDIFIDRHITKLRILSRNYKNIFIITGRGLHSAGGISIIKNKVKTRLKERNLKWSEVNPGLLRVKIFQASKFSKKA